MTGHLRVRKDYELIIQIFKMCSLMTFNGSIVLLFCFSSRLVQLALKECPYIIIFFYVHDAQSEKIAIYQV